MGKAFRVHQNGNKNYYEMNPQLMETITHNGKPIWDTLVIIFGSVGMILQSALAVEIHEWAQIFGGFGIGLFTLIRTYYWIVNDGYEDERP